MAVVNTDLRSLVFGESQGPSLFSFGDADIEATEEVPALQEQQEIEQKDLFQDLNSIKLFFPMLHKDPLPKRSHYQELITFSRKKDL